jgi:hypothetical protein
MEAILDEHIEIGVLFDSPGYDALRYVEGDHSGLHRVLLSRAQSLAHACDEAFDIASEALANGASKADVLTVAEHLARFGCGKAAQLRDKGNGL